MGFVLRLLSQSIIESTFQQGQGCLLKDVYPVKNRPFGPFPNLG